MKAMKPFDVVRVVRLRGKRFADVAPDHERWPVVGDVGSILDVYTAPEPAFEIECSNPKDGSTIWLAAIYPEELELVQPSP